MNIRHPNRRFVAVVALCLAGPACRGGQPEPQTPKPIVSQTDETEEQATSNERQEPIQQESYTATTIVLSPELRKGCELPDTPAEAPQFDYDESDLRPRGADILDGVARCLTTGRLQSHSITIIGRADPRGSEQYNKALGRDRATAARAYLIEKGVPAQRISFVSRGEQGAKGDDKQSWQLDRRVDIDLSRRDRSPASDATGAAPHDLSLVPEK
jgi:outer membrane protein OmpA-like peptidoglycan-associated protein